MRTHLLLAACLLAASPLSANEPRVDYVRDVKPILQERCFGCHGALKQRAGLRLDTGKLIRTGGDSGPAVVAGKIDKSLLVERITHLDKSERMPPKGDPLTKKQIELIKAWIAQGADSPPGERAQENPRDHWSFKRPVRADLPNVKNAEWARNPIDLFIAAEHQQRGLTPLPPAAKHVLLRRVYLDLIGVPPTRAELRAFLDDHSTNAYEKVVDRLLDSPKHGERWGRHWMDVWRYSDWYGRRNVPDVLNSYGQIWRWRDWIVRSLNEDKGYDRMVMEMLAADEICPTDDNSVVATGFIVRNFYRWNYNTWMKDAVEHTGKAFLGLTLNCCHCHDHKYDPVTNEEYFRFRAFFEPIEIRHGRVRSYPDPGVYPKYSYGKAYKPITSGMVRIMDEKLDAKTFIYTGGEARNVIPGRPPVTPGGPAILGGDDLDVRPIELPAEAWYPGLRPFVQQEEIAKRLAAVEQAEATLKKAKQLVAQAKKAKSDVKSTELTLRVDEANLAHAQAELAAIKARVHADNVRYKGKPGDAKAAARAASKAERQAVLEAVRLEMARAERALAQNRIAKKPNLAQVTVRVRKAAAALEKAEKELAKESDSYSPLSHQYPKRSTGRRTALARWIANKQNPLTARVAINHVWRRHFGQAFVATTENLGRNGARPTHPELLDWLAVELMENGWRMKPIHRMIVTSNTYRMASSGQVRNLSYDSDRDNVYLWRFNAARMEAEVLRDSVLHAAGSLSTTLGGKDVAQALGLTNPRRSIYFTHHGEGRMPFLDLFDAADPRGCYRRSTSVRPQQALAMVNSELALRQGRLLARRLDQQIGRDKSERFIDAAFEQILSREPSAAERTVSAAFLKKQTMLFKNAKPEELSAGSKGHPVPPSNDPVLRARESFVQALFSHHDFVTIR